MKEIFIKEEQDIDLDTKNELKEEAKASENDLEKTETVEEKTKFKKAEKKPKKLKKEMKEMEYKKSKNKYIILGISIGILLIIGAIISTVFALFNINNAKIISGVSISGVEVSGLSKEEAKGKIEALYNEKKENEIDIKYQEYETSLNPTVMEVSYNIDKAVVQGCKNTVHKILWFGKDN